MLSTEQAKNIIHLYNKFLAIETKGWSELDDFLEILEWLDNSELYRECEALYSIHKNKKMGCPSDHENGSICYVGSFMEAVEAILDLYKETNSLHEKNRYLLSYYLALCQDGQILSLEP